MSDLGIVTMNKAYAREKLELLLTELDRCDHAEFYTRMNSIVAGATTGQPSIEKRDQVITNLKTALQTAKDFEGEAIRKLKVLEDKKHARFNNDECWIFDDEDIESNELEDLFCPVVLKPDYLLNLLNELSSAKKTVERLTDTRPLDVRMKEAGMITLSEIWSGMPIDNFIQTKEVTSLASFDAWLQSRYKEMSSMFARRSVNKQEDDELYEWVLAHNSVFKEVLINFAHVKKTLPKEDR